MSKIKERLRQVLKNQDIKIKDVIEKTLLSEKYFSNKSSMSTEILEKISIFYPQINMDWVITSRGEMLNTETKIPNKMHNKILATNLLRAKERLMINDKNEAIEKFGYNDFQHLLDCENARVEVPHYIVLNVHNLLAEHGFLSDGLPDIETQYLMGQDDPNYYLKSVDKKSRMWLLLGIEMN